MWLVVRFPWGRCVRRFVGLALLKLEGGRGFGVNGVSLVDGTGCGVVFLMNRGLGLK